MFIYTFFTDLYSYFLQDFINENVITDFQEDFVVDLDKQNNERSVTLFFIRPELSTGMTAFTSDKTSRLMVHVHCLTPVPVPRPLLIKCVQNRWKLHQTRSRSTITTSEH